MEPLYPPAPPSRWRSESQEIGSFYTFLKEEVERLKSTENDASTQAMKQSNLILKEFVSFNPRLQKMYFDHQRNKTFEQSNYPQSYRPSEPRLKIHAGWDSSVKPDSVSCDGTIVTQSQAEQFQELALASDAPFHFETSKETMPFDSMQRKKTSPDHFTRPNTQTSTKTSHDRHDQVQIAAPDSWTSPQGNFVSEYPHGEARVAEPEWTKRGSFHQGYEVRVADPEVLRTSRGSLLFAPEEAANSFQGSFQHSAQGVEVRVADLETLKTSRSNFLSETTLQGDEVRAVIPPGFPVASFRPDHPGVDFYFKVRGGGDPEAELVRSRVPDHASGSQTPHLSKDNRRLDRVNAFRELSSDQLGPKPEGISYKPPKSSKPRSRRLFYS